MVKIVIGAVSVYPNRLSATIVLNTREETGRVFLAKTRACLTFWGQFSGGSLGARSGPRMALDSGIPGAARHPGTDFPSLRSWAGMGERFSRP